MKHVTVKFHTRFHKQVFSKKELYRFRFKYTPEPNDTGFLTIGPVTSEDAALLGKVYVDYHVNFIDESY